MKQGIIAIVIAAISLIVAGFTNYARTDKATAVDIATVQTQQANDDKRLERIENKVDSLDDKIDQVLAKIR